jgi:hypothetical protein
MQKQDRRGFLVACFAVENIYAIDGDSLNSGGWDDVGHLFVGVCEAIQDLTGPLYCCVRLRLDQQIAVKHW